MLHHQLNEKYSLCDYCFYRQLAGAKKRNKLNGIRSSGIRITRRNSNSKSKSCHICQGIMGQLDSITEKICDVVEEGKYEFDSFLLGGTLPSATFDREDSIRSRFKIRGRQNIKKQFIDELRKKFKNITGKRLEHINPDITIQIIIIIDNQNISSPTISVKSSPLFLAGRYVKTRLGLPQKKDKCQICLGSGCVSCNYLGASSLNSVEAIIARRILEITRGENPKFSWIGSEDKNSLVLGKGRPFLLRISNPKIRSLKTDLKVQENGVCAVIKQGKPQDSFKVPAHFITKTRINIECERHLQRRSLRKLLSVLENTEVTFKAKSKIVSKKIYSLKLNQVNENKFDVTLIADGGLLIKQFVGGQEYHEPNISKIIGSKCECTAFDILDVKVQQ